MAAEIVIECPIVGEQFGVEPLRLALRALTDADDAYPRELRVAPDHWGEYWDTLIEFLRDPESVAYWRAQRAAGAQPELQFNGVPLRPDATAPPMVLRAVYPFVREEAAGEPIWSERNQWASYTALKIREDAKR